MNEAIENKIIELIDQGKTPENSLELKNILESSSEAQNLYENLLMNDANLKNLFADEYVKFNNKIDSVNDYQQQKIKKHLHDLNPQIRETPVLFVSAKENIGFENFLNDNNIILVVRNKCYQDDLYKTNFIQTFKFYIFKFPSKGRGNFF